MDSTPTAHRNDPSFAAFLTAAGKVPLLDHAQEVVLGRALRERHRELELLLVSSPLFWREVLAWGDKVSSGSLSAADLMPRGRKTSAQLAAMRRRLNSVCRLLRRALLGGAPARRAAEALGRLGLHKKRLDAFAEGVRSDAALVGELRNELTRYHARYGGDYARLERYLRRRAAGTLSGAELRELAGAPEAAISADLARVRVLQGQLRALTRSAGGDPDALLDLARELAQAQGRVAEARTALVEANIRLAVSVAKRFSHTTMDFADLVQEGTLGLMKAADRYDERRGFKFSTYATWWVRQSIQRAIADKGAVIRQPAHVQGLRERLRRAVQRYRDLHGREPSTAELARRLRLAPDVLRAAVETAAEPLSFSASPPGTDDTTLEESLKETEQPTPLAAVKKVLRQDEVGAALAKLPQREATVLKLRYGIGCERPLTLEDCGRRLGLTRERVRQIERHAIGRLKAARISCRLRDYWGAGQ